MREKKMGRLGKLMAGVLMLVALVTLMPWLSSRAYANTTEYDAETKTLTLKAGEVVLKDVTPYSRNAKVVHVVAAPGAVFPERSEGMFKDFYYATSIDLSNADMSKVTCMDFMFANCKALTSVKLNDVDTSNVTTMQCLFSGCESLTSLDLTALDTKRTQSMTGMFRDCSKLSSINFGDFDTSMVIKMNGMFQNTGFASLDLTGFNTSFCITMYEMFQGCTNLTTLNLSSFDTSNVDSVESMFSGDSKLKTIYVSHLWNNKKVKYSNDEFKDCTSIVGGMGTTYRPDRVDVTYAHVDRGGDPGYFTYKKFFEFMFQPQPATCEVIGDSLTFSAPAFGASAFQWHLVDESGKEISWSDVAQYGWATVSDNSNLSNTLQLDKVQAGLDGKKVYCEIKSPVGYVANSEAVTISVKKKVKFVNAYIPNFQDAVAGRNVNEFTTISFKNEMGRTCSYMTGTVKWYLFNREITDYEMGPHDGLGIRIDVNLKDGYEFADARVCNLYDGKGNKIIMDRVTGPETATYSTFTTNYEVPVPEGGMKIDSISRKIAEPVAGEAPATALVALGRIEQRAAHYTVQSVSWTPEVNVFAPGKDYVLTIIYKADEDYGFYADSEFYINDKKMQRSAIQMGKGGWVEVSYRFSLGGQVLQITKQPKDYYGTIGKKASFSVTAVGDDLTYEWQYKKSGEWIAYGVTSYDTPNFTVSMNTKNVKWPIRCVITDAYGETAITKEVWMKDSSVDAPIKITQQPTDWYGSYGKKASFSVVATGNGLSFQWQYKKSDKWINYAITTADTSNLKVTMNEKNVNWPIRCKITDEDGHVILTNEVMMHEGTAPAPDPTPAAITITQQPVDWYGMIGKKAKFSVVATGNGLTYQWQYKKGTADWTDYAIATADTANFQVSMSEKTMKWTYRCVITDADGNTVTTNEVKMYEGTAPAPTPAGITITSQPRDFTGKTGKKASFSVTATGEGLTYEWQVKKATTWSAYTLAGYDTPTFQVSISDKTAKWAYRCVVRDASGNEIATNEVRIIVAE